jgi:hypothetical protein
MAIKQGKHDPRAWLAIVLGLCLAFSVRAQPVVAEQAWARATVPNQDLADMQALKVDRTRGFIVNGTPLRDFGEVQLKALVELELKKAAGP